MTLSIHDNLIISYEVLCKERTIILRTEYRVENKPTEFTNVVFKEVQGYHFENDAFGNIIFAVEPVSAEHFLREYGAQVSELYRMTGSPTWAKDIATVPDQLREQGVKAIILSSSLGLSGWVLAKDMSIVAAEPGVFAEIP